QVVTRVLYSPDGRQLASASDDGTIRIWDPPTGQPVRTIRGHQAQGVKPGGITWVAYRPPDGRHLASVGREDPSVRVWATTTGERTVVVWDAGCGEVIATLSGHTDIVPAPAFSPDSRRLATPSADESVRVWDAATGEPIRTLRGHRGWVQGVAFSLDGRQL